MIAHEIDFKVFFHSRKTSFNHLRLILQLILSRLHRSHIFTIVKCLFPLDCSPLSTLRLFLNTTSHCLSTYSITYKSFNNASHCHLPPHHHHRSLPPCYHHSYFHPIVPHLGCHPPLHSHSLRFSHQPNHFRRFH